MTRLAITLFNDIFQLLSLFFEMIFVVMIGLIGCVFYLPQQDNQNIKKWDQSLTARTMCYFDLSCKDQCIFNCIRMLKFYFQQLQIFTNAKMSVNGIFLMVYDILLTYIVMNVVILLRYTFVNDLLLHFFYGICFISMDITETETQAARTTIINNILLWIWFSVITIAARRIIHQTVVSIIETPHIQKMKNLLHLNSSDDLYDALNEDGITTNTGDIKFECNIAVSDNESPYETDTTFLNQSEKQYLSFSGVCDFVAQRLKYQINYCSVFAHFMMLAAIMMKQDQIQKLYLLLIGMVSQTCHHPKKRKNRNKYNATKKQKRKRIE